MCNCCVADNLSIYFAPLCRSIMKKLVSIFGNIVYCDDIVELICSFLLQALPQHTAEIAIWECCFAKMADKLQDLGHQVCVSATCSIDINSGLPQYPIKGNVIFSQPVIAILLRSLSCKYARNWVGISASTLNVINVQKLSSYNHCVMATVKWHNENSKI